MSVLKVKYAYIRRKALSIFYPFAGVGIVLALGLGHLWENKIMRPVLKRLNDLSRAFVTASENKVDRC